MNSRCVDDKKGGAYLKTYKEKTKIPSSEIGFSLVTCDDCAVRLERQTSTTVRLTMVLPTLYDSESNSEFDALRNGC